MSKYARIIDIEKLLYRKGFCIGKTPDELYEALTDLPTIDIVRCKDCKHGEYREDFDNYLCDQLGLGSVTDEDDFCSYGERKNK